MWKGTMRSAARRASGMVEGRVSFYRYECQCSPLCHTHLLLKDPVVLMVACSLNIFGIFGTNNQHFRALRFEAENMGPCGSELEDLSGEVPALTVMSLRLRTNIDHHENKHEVVCASTRTWHNSERIVCAWVVPSNTSQPSSATRRHSTLGVASSRGSGPYPIAE